MAQPLPDWLKMVTLRYQDSDKFTTGLVEMPISYSGPSIPLEWPYTSVPTASLPLPSAAPSSAQVINFIDGNGPFTVVGDVILTDAASTTPPPMTSTPTPSFVLVSTIVLALPTPSTQSSPNGDARPPSNPLALGFILLLTILILLIFVIAVTLIKSHQRRESHARIVAKNGDCSYEENHYEFHTTPHPQDRGGSPVLPTQSRDMHDHIPILIHQHTSVNAHVEEKELIQPETEFHIIPPEQPQPHTAKWMGWKKWIPQLPNLFRKNNTDRAGLVYNPPLPHINVHYFNPYHDPSINTDTDERVSRWQMKCDSPSPSALQLPSTISSNKRDSRSPSDDKAAEVGLSGTVHVLAMDSFGFKNRKSSPHENPVFNFNPSSTVSGPTVKLESRSRRALKDLSASKVMRTAAMHTLLECASPRRNVVKSESNYSKNSLPPGALSKATAHLSRSLGALTKSSCSTGKRSTFPRYHDDSPPLLIAECDGETFENDDTDPGDSPLDFITIPLRSPPRCRRGTLSTSPATGTVLENSLDSVRLPPSLFPSSSSLPLRCPAEIAGLKASLHASPWPQLPSPSSSREPQNDPTFASELAPSLSFQPPSSSLDTPTSVRKKRGKLPVMKHSNSTFCAKQALATSPDTMIKSVRNGSSLDVHFGHEGSSQDGARNSNDRDAFPLTASLNSLKLPLGNRPAGYDHDSAADPGNETTRKTSEEAHNSRHDEEVVFNGFFGSGSIGNMGGVSELGILETGDRSLEIDVEYPVSVSSRRLLTSPQATSELAEEEGHGRILEHLFAVNPAVRRALGSQRIKPYAESRPQPFETSPDSLSSAADVSGAGQKISNHSQARSALEATQDPKIGGNDDGLTPQDKHSSDSSVRARSTHHSSSAEGNLLQTSRRSASSSVLGSLFSFGQQSRRCVSFPSGMENDTDVHASNNFSNLGAMLQHARSPLQRITERWRQHSLRGEEQDEEAEIGSMHGFESEDGMEKDDDDDEADENCRLLLAPDASTS